MIVATAGHIDHGKTALVRALTGVDADRLPEERRRGITVDLGFAYAPLAALGRAGSAPSGGERIGFVDVPGHERLVRNMLAGAIGVDALLLVVAADDGPMPQTREHLAIADLIGLPGGVVALTKSDRVDAARLVRARHEVAELVAGTVMDGAPVIVASSVTGEGIDDLAAALRAKAEAEVEAAAPDDRGFRLAIDRAFTVPGHGLVVTGTARAGAVARGDRLAVSREGGGEPLPVRVRGLHVQDREAETGRRGQRVALNLAGAGRGEVGRGDWAIAPWLHAPTARLDVDLRLLASEGRPLRHWTPVHAHLGTSDVTGRVAVLEGREIAPGERAHAQIVLDRPVAALWGDRFILRDQSATRTVGGGAVIDPHPPRRGARRPERRAAVRALALPGSTEALVAFAHHAPSGIDLGAFALARNLAPETVRERAADAGLALVADRAGPRAVSPERWAVLGAAIQEAVERHAEADPSSPGVTVGEIARGIDPALRPLIEARLAELAERGRVARRGALAHPPAHAPRLTDEDEATAQAVEDALAAAHRERSLDQPRLSVLTATVGLEEEALRTALGRIARLGRVMRIDRNYAMLPCVARGLALAAVRAAAKHDAGLLTVGRFREETGLTRHMTMPVLEYFDKVGLTLRHRDGRRLRGDPDALFPEAEMPRSASPARDEEPHPAARG